MPRIGLLRARIETRLAGPRVGAFWRPGDLALISNCQGQPGSARGKPARVDRQSSIRLPDGLSSPDPRAVSKCTGRRLGNGKSRPNAVRLPLQLLAYNLGNFKWTLVLPKAAEPWSLTSLHEKLRHAYPRPLQYRCVNKHVPHDLSVLITAETSRSNPASGGA
jgi:hypothetical protein